MSRKLAMLPLSLLLMSCSGEGRSEVDLDRADPGSELIASATVIEREDGGPHLCVGAVMSSLPPQCGGPSLVGWDWEAVGGSEAMGDVQWGDYVVVGTYDESAGSFTLTRPAVPRSEYDGPDLYAEAPSSMDFSTRCPEPEGGWRVLDPALAKDNARRKTWRIFRHLPGHGLLWLDRTVNPDAPTPKQLGRKWRLRANDPALFVLNVETTKDLAETESIVRETWGGALCVSKARFAARELNLIEKELRADPRHLSVGTGRDHVDVQVIYDDGTLQDQLDDRYGKGVVRVSSALQPYEP